MNTRAQIRFDSQHLVLPNNLIISMMKSYTNNVVAVNTQVQLESTINRQQTLRKLLQKFPKIFQTTQITSQINLPVTHSIETADGAPIYVTSRRRSPLEHARINKAVEEMLQKGIIEPSKSNWVSEPHLVKKDDGTYRFCIDFRELNKVKLHDRYSLPRIDDLLGKLGQSRYFTSLDLASGY